MTELLARVEQEREAHAQLEARLEARREAEVATLAALAARSRNAAARLEALRAEQAASLAQVASLQAQLARLQGGLPRLRLLWVRFGLPVTAAIGPLVNLVLLILASELHLAALPLLQGAGGVLGLVVAVALHREASDA